MRGPSYAALVLAVVFAAGALSPAAAQVGVAPGQGSQRGMTGGTEAAPTEVKPGSGNQPEVTGGTEGQGIEVKPGKKDQPAMPDKSRTPPSPPKAQQQPAGMMKAAYLCQGKTATIVAESHAGGPLNGTPGPDVIAGLDGVDRIDGKGGNDVICGGGGDDVIRGGPGSDRIEGGPGGDTLYGLAGNDVLKGESGMDRLYGGAGNDELYGGNDRDVLDGENGNDILNGGGGIDSCSNPGDYFDKTTGCENFKEGKGLGKKFSVPTKMVPETRGFGKKVPAKPGGAQALGSKVEAGKGVGGAHVVPSKVEIGKGVGDPKVVAPKIGIGKETGDPQVVAPGIEIGKGVGDPQAPPQFLHLAPGFRRFEPGEVPEDPGEQSTPVIIPSGSVIQSLETKLQARQGSKDFAEWRSLYSESDPMPVTFRWTTKVKNLGSAQLQVSRRADFTEIVRSEDAGPAPLPGEHRLFTVDFRAMEGLSNERPLTYHVRLLPQLMEGVDPAEEQPLPSSVVVVKITGPGPDTSFQMPEITDVMPFSACTPGGAIILKGIDFGDEKGELKLIGDFPDGAVRLVQLEWTDHSVGGQVPPITGVFDQPVTIMLVSKEGRKSNPVPCAFLAMRETRTIPFPGGFSGRWCDQGGNADTGQNLVFPDVQGDGTVLVSDVGSSGGHWFGCRHSNNRQGGDNSGKDVFETVWLQNGWSFKRMAYDSYSTYTSADPGQILGITGWSKGSTKADLRVEWFVPEGQRFRYGMSLYMEGPAGVPFKQ